MLIPVYTKQFNKDIKKLKGANKKFEKLKYAITKLINGERLEHKYLVHKLAGNYKGRRECHIEADWLLIYKIEGENIIFERTGSHSELF